MHFAGALYANWQFNQSKSVLLEDSYVNNNGILYGKPEFADDDDGEHMCIVFNGKDQYAEAPPSVADFGELTIDMMINRAAGKYGELQNEIRQLHQQKAALHKTAKLEELETRAREAEKAKNDEVAKLDTRIQKLHEESQALRDNALKSARLLGRNPYPGRDVTRLRDFQQSLIYHTSADWDDRTREEVGGKAPPKMKKWLLRVRGY